MPDLRDAIHVAAYGMKAQSERLKVVSQNIANADSTGTAPGEEPYRRQTISFKNVLDRKLGTEVVKVAKRGVDPTPFQYKYQPGHPAADENGYVLMPNVNTVLENADLREAERSYEANLSVIESSKAMLNRTLDIMR